MQSLGAYAHRIVHRRALREWHEGFPLGNGTLGAMLWGDGEPLCLTLDRADLWDLRHNATYQDDPSYSYAGLLRLAAEGRLDEA
jgi:alpha-L-fucosidase 2